MQAGDSPAGDSGQDKKKAENRQGREATQIKETALQKALCSQTLCYP